MNYTKREKRKKDILIRKVNDEFLLAIECSTVMQRSGESLWNERSARVRYSRDRSPIRREAQRHVYEVEIRRITVMFFLHAA